MTKYFIVLPGRDDAVGCGQRESLCCAIEELELSGFVFFLRLLSAERHLRGHHALPLGYEGALCAHAVLPATVAFVTFKRRHNAMITAAGALGRARIFLCGAQQQRRASQQTAGHGHGDGGGCSGSGVNLCGRLSARKLRTKIHDLSPID